MASTLEFEGQTEDEAVQKACSVLHQTEKDLDYIVVDEGSTGLFGLGSRPVRIRARAPEGKMTGATEELKTASELEKPIAGEEIDAGAEEEGPGIIGPAPEKAAKAKEVAEGLTSRMGLPCIVSVRDEEARIVVVIEEVEGSSAVADMLGRSRPPAVPSLQFLLNKIVNRFPEDRKHILLEVPSVPRKAPAERRQRKPIQEPGRGRAPVELDPDLDPTLVALGRELAARALALGKVITVHPMLPGDRRAIHQTIMTVEGVETISQGDGLYRRMHIVPSALKGSSSGGSGGSGGAGGGGFDRGSGRRRRRRRRGNGASHD